MKFEAIVHRFVVDKDGEVKITLCVSETEATKVREIPTGKVLDVEITSQEEKIFGALEDGAVEDPRD